MYISVFRLNINIAPTIIAKSKGARPSNQFFTLKAISDIITSAVTFITSIMAILNYKIINSERTF